MAGLAALINNAMVASGSVSTVAQKVMADAVQASARTIGVIIDDTAVIPGFLEGVSPDRELPIVWKITKGSLRNKILILLPLLLLLNTLAPGTIAYLLLICGSYLSYEGAEKIIHYFAPHEAEEAGTAEAAETPEQMEEERIDEAVRTDFVMSAEVMVVALASLKETDIYLRAGSLFVVAVLITFIVYSSVALILKMDDIGLRLAKEGHFKLTRWIGRVIVKAMPGFLRALSVVGTLAMLWVGGEIVSRSLQMAKLWGEPFAFITRLGVQASKNLTGFWAGAVEWFVTAGLNAVFGLLWGIMLVLVYSRIVKPLLKKIPLRDTAASNVAAKDTAPES